MRTTTRSHHNQVNTVQGRLVRNRVADIITLNDDAFPIQARKTALVQVAPQGLLEQSPHIFGRNVRRLRASVSVCARVDAAINNQPGLISAR